MPAERDSVPDLVAGLLDPQAYPEPRPASVELVSTHISWVFLTATDAWKLKRPVTFPFLDFGTLERRRHFCEEEVRLGRRLAAGIYRGVVPVRKTAGGYVFGDGDRDGAPIVEYAVRMRRLPDAWSARARLERGALGPGELRRLAARLARFYATADHVAGAGSVEAVTQLVRGNVAELEPLAGACLQRDHLDAVTRAVRRDLEQVGELLEARRAAGRIRDGHGDLRLEHVYFTDAEADAAGDIVIVDALEFNGDLRCCDTALDACFFAMELEASGRSDLAAYFLYRFARESEDYDFYPLIDLYVCHRALVRAKVACLLAADRQTPATKTARKREEAERLLALALEHAQLGARPIGDRGAVVAVGGLVGTGKSTLAEALALEIGFPVVSSDRVRKHLSGVAAEDRAPAAAYTAGVTARTYDEIFRRAAAVLDAGRGVILDATFSERAHRDAARAFAERRALPFLFVETTCPPQVVEKRVRERASGPSESDADLAVLAEMRRRFQAVDELHELQKLVVDTTQPAPLSTIASRLLALRAQQAPAE